MKSSQIVFKYGKKYSANNLSDCLQYFSVVQQKKKLRNENKIGNNDIMNEPGIASELLAKLIFRKCFA